ncbi:MAG: Na+/H+ antiporter NhaA [Actinobacteria bacterium]|nr:Na+/H+ antiporter NhaA [Actinomycetota bacterium]MBU1865957.1 Na+/H+ antiporter NhaA [Actinomycetota bacterium]
MTHERLHSTWLHSERALPSRFVQPMLRFTQIESAGGVVMLAAAVLALAWANSPWGDSYNQFWGTEFSLELGAFHFQETLVELVNDGLMVIFFYVVGLEIKRELVLGDLRDPKAASLPVLGALGGMIFPALLYLLIVGGGEAGRGWGIPMATDIAFSVGVLSLMGRRIPVGAKLFLLTLAIVDDIGAILVIAVFYTDQLAFGWLAMALGGLLLVWLASRAGIRSLAFYIAASVATWYFLLESGVHATLAGVALGFLTPAFAMYTDEEYQSRASRLLARQQFDAKAPRAAERLDTDALEMSAVARESVPPLARMEHALLPWSSFLVVPVFALANAGVDFRGVDIGKAITHPVALGVAVGLIVGKTVGISIFSFVAVKLGLARLPRHTGWAHIVGVAAVAGIGFTVALFVTALAFDPGEIADRAKTGIFLGSIIAGVLGTLLLRTRKPRPDPSAPDSDPAPHPSGHH